MRTDPFQELDRLTRPADRRFLAMDAVRSEDEVLVYVDVPGVSPDDIDLTVEQNQIDLTVRRRWDQSGQRVLASERQQGVFSRQFVVGDNLATDQLRAKLENGVLVLAIPVAEEAKPKQIQVTEASGTEKIEASS